MVENVKAVSEIAHPAVRGCLELDRSIDLAIERHADKQRLRTSM